LIQHLYSDDVFIGNGPVKSDQVVVLRQLSVVITLTFLETSAGELRVTFSR